MSVNFQLIKELECVHLHLTRVEKEKQNLWGIAHETISYQTDNENNSKSHIDNASQYSSVLDNSYSTKGLPWYGFTNKLNLNVNNMNNAGVDSYNSNYNNNNNNAAYVNNNNNNNNINNSINNSRLNTSNLLNLSRDSNNSTHYNINNYNNKDKGFKFDLGTYGKIS